MRKKVIKQATMLNVKGLLYLSFFGIWVFLMMGVSYNLVTIKDFLFFYGGNTVFVIGSLYIALLILEFFVDIKDVN